MSHGSPPRILVVDDDRLVRTAMVRTLKCVPGATVEDFADPADALARADAVPFDAAVLDLTMPVMDGVRLAGALREKLPGLRVIFVTANPHGEIAQRARAFPSSILLPKPWRPEDLLQLLMS